VINKVHVSLKKTNDNTKQYATSLGLQVQSYNKSKFSVQGNSGFISKSRGTVVKALSILVRQPAKHSPCLASPTPPSGCQAQDVEYK
jgi:hypothetical protein